jgi:hypothetical protein
VSPRVAAARVRPLLVPAGILLVVAGLAGLLLGGPAGVVVLALPLAAHRIAPPPAPVTVVVPPVRGRGGR